MHNNKCFQVISMNPELKQLAVDFIAMPFAKAAFKHETRNTLANFYLDYTDEAIRLIKKSPNCIVIQIK